MRGHISSNDFSEPILHHLWFGKLYNSSIVQKLMLMTDDTSLGKLVDIADKIFTSYNHLLNSLKPRDKKEMNCHCKKLEESINLHQNSYNYF